MEELQCVRLSERSQSEKAAYYVTFCRRKTIRRPVVAVSNGEKDERDD
jgi:hypothetical protein